MQKESSEGKFDAGLRSGIGGGTSFGFLVIMLLRGDRYSCAGDGDAASEVTDISLYIREYAFSNNAYKE